MQRVLVILAVIVLVTASLGVGALAANWPFWRRAWAWHAADAGWPQQLPGPWSIVRGGGAAPLQFGPAAPDLAAEATQAATQLLLRVRDGVADAWRAPGADEKQPVDGRGLSVALLEPLFAGLQDQHPGLLDQPVGAWIEAWRQDQRGALTPRELLDLIAAGIDVPPAPSPLNPFSVRARLAAGPGFDRAALLAFSPTATERRAAAAQILAGIASTLQSQPFASVLETQLWSRLAEADARLMTDRRGQHSAAHCCVQATPADWLRLGLHRARAMAAGQAPQTIATAGRALVFGAGGAVLWIGTGAAPSGLEMLLPQAAPPAAAQDE